MQLGLGPVSPALTRETEWSQRLGVSRSRHRQADSHSARPSQCAAATAGRKGSRTIKLPILHYTTPHQCIPWRPRCRPATGSGKVEYPILVSPFSRPA